MESTTTARQFLGAEASLSEPHFDEEATLLSARAVVPLASLKGLTAVKAKTSFPRPWILGLGLVGALLVGIFATAIYYSRLEKNHSKFFDDAEVAAGVEANTTKSEDSFSGPTAAQPAVIADRGAADVSRQASARSQPLKSSAGPARNPVARLEAVITEARSSEQAIGGAREDRKAARKQARQEQRRAEREKRDSGSADDLLRIRDIFEGLPRP